MPRQPAAIELQGGRGPRQRVWEAIRAAGEAEWENHQIARAAGVPEETARDYLHGLVAAGIVAEVRTEPRGRVACRKWFRIADDRGVEAPRVRRDGRPVTQGLGQEQMWRTLRLLKGDTNARELAAHASTEQVPVAVKAAADYLHNLHHAGYLQRTAEASTGRVRGARRVGAQARYRLISNTGPRPPMVCRTDVMYDPNLGEAIWIRPVTEEDAIYGR